MTDTKIPVAPLGADAAREDEFQVYSAPSLIRFLQRGVQPPSYVYLKHTDTLQVGVASRQIGEAVTFNYRLLRADGALVKGQFIVQVTTSVGPVFHSEPMAEGFLLSLSCKAAVATTRGQTFARAYFTSGALGPNQPNYTLFADYITTQIGTGHPNGRVLAPSEGPGWRNVLFFASPAAGAEWTFTVPVGVRWRLLSLSNTLTCSAAVANRQPGLKFTTGAVSPYLSICEVNVTASQAPAITYNSQRFVSVAPASVVWVATPANALLLGGDVVSSNTPGLQAGDQYSLVVVDVEEWLDNV